LSVAKEARRQGIASRLIDELKKQAVKEGVKALTLNSGLTSEQYKAAFDGFMANPVELTIYTAICMAIVAFISARGIKNGIEKVCNVLMPLLFVMLIILAIRSVTLPGAMEGVKWYLKIDFSKIDFDKFK